MKKLIKELAKFEGLKSEAKIGNVRELTKVTAAIIAASYALEDSSFYDERHLYEDKMLAKAHKRVLKGPITFDELVKYLLGRK